MLSLILAQNESFSFSGNITHTDIFVNISDDYIAYGVLEDFNSTSARYHLLIETAKISNSSLQFYYEGYAEGYLTADLILMHLKNVKYDLYENESADWIDVYKNYYVKNNEYINDEFLNHQDDEWWILAHDIMHFWLSGVADGVQAKLNYRAVTEEDLYLLNAQGDAEDIDGLYEETREKYIQRIENGLQHRCTGTVRHSPSFDDVWFSQDTWTDYYGGFLRIAKVYKINFVNSETVQQNITFSSEPGLFFSLDDFYIIENTNAEQQTSNLAVLETTYHTFNEDLFQYMDKYGDSSALTWLRCQLSNIIAFTPSQWNTAFEKQQSWTYNNNYLFLDYKAFEEVLANADKNYESRVRYILDNHVALLTTLEVVPSVQMLWDATPAFIEEKWYISINVPVNDTLFVLSGYAGKKDPYWSYNESSRYCISSRDLPDISSYDSFLEYVRYNDYLHDPCSNGDSGQAISSRYDWRKPTTGHDPALMGATDSKVVSYAMAKQFIFDFIVGPISGGNSKIPPFNFSSKGSDYIDNYDFFPHGYYAVFPNVWQQTSNFSCLGSESCKNGACNYGICECYKGFKLSNENCVEAADYELIMWLCIGIPVGVVVILLVVWAIFELLRKSKKPYEQLLVKSV